MVSKLNLNHGTLSKKDFQCQIRVRISFGPYWYVCAILLDTWNPVSMVSQSTDDCILIPWRSDYFLGFELWKRWPGLCNSRIWWSICIYQKGNHFINIVNVKHLQLTKAFFPCIFALLVGDHHKNITCMQMKANFLLCVVRNSSC